MSARLVAGCGLVAALLVAQDQGIRSRVFVEGHFARYGAGGGGMSGRLAREQAVADLGAGGVRLDIEWSRIGRVRGTLDWSRIDSTVSELQMQGLAAFGLLTFSPGWAVPHGMPERHRPVVDGSEARGDTAFAAFAAAAARRYHGFIHKWEIWNEENTPVFWIDVVKDTNVGPSASDYLHLFTLARDSIHSVDSSALVSIGGLAALSGRFQDVRDPAGSARFFHSKPAHVYLRDLIQAGWVPGITALHPYSGLPPGQHRLGEQSSVFPNQVFDSTLAVLDAAGYHTTSVWITEWGVNVRPGLSPDAVSQWFQSALKTMLCNPRVAFVTVYAVTDSGAGTNYGLFSGDGTRTSGGAGLSAAITGWRGCGE